MDIASVIPLLTGLSVGILAVLLSTKVEPDRKSGTTTFTTMGFIKTFVCGDSESTTVFGVTVYERAGGAKRFLGGAWRHK